MTSGSSSGRAHKRMNPASSPETRQRLVEAATVLFAERGFTKVTVREICGSAKANVAAVNYHFGDKAGLYREVVKNAIQSMRETDAISQRAGEGGSPEDRLRAYVRTFLQRLTERGRQSWIHKLMARELEEPTDALDLVMRQAIQPRHEYLSGIVAAIAGLAAGDPRVLRSIASVQGQCLLFARPLPAQMAKLWAPITSDVGAAADHIVDFSLAGIRAIARHGRPT